MTAQATTIQSQAALIHALNETVHALNNTLSEQASIIQALNGQVATAQPALEWVDLGSVDVLEDVLRRLMKEPGVSE